MKDIAKHKFVIFGSSTANTLGQIRGLGEKGINPIVVLVNRNTYRVDKSRYVLESFNVDNIENGLDLILNKYGNEAFKTFLYTDRDDIIGLLDRRYDELKDKFIFWNAGETGRLNHYLNKNVQIELAVKCGFWVPQTEMVRVGEFPQKLSYPIFTKAVDSLNPYWKGNAYICHNEDELKKAYSKMDIKEVLLQEYIAKQDEMPIEGVSLNGGDEIILIGKTVSHRLLKDTFSTYRYVVPFSDLEIEKKTKAFIQEVGYSGPFEIEFILQDDKMYFLEVNFRIAQQNYGYTKLGANIPYIYALSELYGHITSNEIVFVPGAKVDIMHEFEDLKNSVIHGNVSIWEWLNDFRSTQGLYFYNKNDKYPFFYTLFSKFSHFMGA